MSTAIAVAEPGGPDLSAAVNRALAAFATDVSYAVAMASAATAIDRKRRVWQARKELRAAEAAAHTECATTEPFTCHAVSACGTGDCKFAHGDYGRLVRGARGGPSRRPQAPHDYYSIEDAVDALVERRGGDR